MCEIMSGKEQINPRLKLNLMQYKCTTYDQDHKKKTSRDPKVDISTCGNRIRKHKKTKNARERKKRRQLSTQLGTLSNMKMCPQGGYA